MSTLTRDPSEVSWNDIRTLVASLAIQSQETDRRMPETDKQLPELGKQVAGLGDKFGYFAEGMALPSMERILQTRFCMETVSPRVRVRREGREQEYDVLAWTNSEVNTVVVVEIKSRVKLEAIAQLQQQIIGLPQRGFGHILLIKHLKRWYAKQPELLLFEREPTNRPEPDNFLQIWIQE